MSSNDYFKVIQITDAHLSMDNNAVHGVDCNRTFVDVVNRVRQEELRDTNAIFLTGDMSHDGSDISYEAIVKAFSGFRLPIIWIPGNHDVIDVMDSVFDVEFFSQGKILKTDWWDFVFLNSNKSGSNSGYLSNTEISFLNKCIRNIGKSKSLAIVMHHHPVETGRSFIDKYILENRDDFWQSVGDRVKMVMCGHVHGDYKLQCLNATIETSPATCVQWKKGTAEREIDKNIGYKVYYFRDGNYEADSKIWSP